MDPKEAAKRQGAVLYKGKEAFDNAIRLLEGVGLPGGLLPLRKVIESGHVKETGYVWITQEEEVRHTFEAAGKQVSYGTEIKGYLEPNRMRELTGVKAKELFIWAPVNDISVPSSAPNKISFKSFGGIAKSFNRSVFVEG